jgi:phosphoribosylformimino-5-aminoimidazole carboxamide ribotide isomerase
MAAMMIYPAIDLKDGQCVRLRHGDFAQATVYNPDPADQARQFAETGSQWLHVVDLDGAVEGRAVNQGAVEAIVRQVPGLSIQLGGGIRSVGAVERWLEAGIQRVILGTVALTKPEVVREACHLFPGRVAVGVDARNGMVATDGWLTQTATSVLEVAKEMEQAGVAAFIFTDIGRDGAGSGVNVEATEALAGAVTVPVIASGGVNSLQDITALKQAKGIAGVIIGRALYDRIFTLEEALQAAC